MSIGSKNTAPVPANLMALYKGGLLLLALLALPQPVYAQQPTATPSVQANTNATLAPPTVAACASMKAPYRAGLWEVISTSNNSLMPQPITAKIKRCVTEKETQNACGLNQLAGGRNQDCQLVDMHITNNKATWAMRCHGTRFSAKGQGESTFLADAYHGSFTMNASMQGKPMQINTTFIGQRLRNCK